VKVTTVPEHIAPEGLAVMLTEGVTDVFIITFVVPATLVQPLTVAVTLYVPAIARVDDAVEGF
jgi:hypothetical protein